MQLLLGMDSLLKISLLGTLPAQQITRPLHCVLDLIYRYFTNVASKATKTRCMCIPIDSSTGSVTYMARSTSSLAMLLWCFKTVTSLLETLQTRSTQSPPKEEPIQTKILEFPFTTLGSQPPQT